MTPPQRCHQRNYGAGAQRWFVKWIETEQTSEGEIVERVRELRGLVDSGAGPVEVLDGILDAVGVSKERKVLRTIAFNALHLTHGATAVWFETNILGGPWCLAGTHMRGMFILENLLKHPSILTQLGTDVDYDTVAGLAMLAQLTAVCKDSEDGDFSSTVRRFCRENRKVLKGNSIFKELFFALAGPRAPALWRVLDRPLTGNDTSTTCAHVQSTEVKRSDDDPREDGARERFYQVRSKGLGEPYRVAPDVRGLRRWSDAKRHALKAAKPFVDKFASLLEGFDARAPSLGVLPGAAPSRVMALHGMSPSVRLVSQFTPAFQRAPCDPGPVGCRDRDRPRYQEDRGAHGHSRILTYGIVHPAAGTPLGDAIGARREAAREGNKTKVPSPCLTGANYGEDMAPDAKKPRLTKEDREERLRELDAHDASKGCYSEAELAERRDARAAKEQAAQDALAERGRAPERARDRAAWRCQTCGKASNQVPRTVGKFCRSCYDRARKAAK